MMHDEEEGMPIEAQVVDSAPRVGMVQSAPIGTDYDIQIATAKRWPRRLAEVGKLIKERATADVETAMACFYTLERKEKDGTKKQILGKSVRLAEIAFAAYGNARIASRYVGETQDGKNVIVEAAIHDLENNTFRSAQVVSKVVGSRGNRYPDDMVAMNIMGASSRASRNVTFAAIPAHLVEPAYKAAREVAVGKQETLVKRRGEVLARLSLLSPLITTPKILAKLGKSDVSDINLDDLAIIIGFGTAIKEGASAEAIFGEEPKVQREGGLDASILAPTATLEPTEPAAEVPAA